MASTGTALWPGASTFPGTAVFPGQGLAPIVRCRISYDDVSVATPAWTEVTNSDLRAFASSRGRDTELSEFDAGTATAAIDNRDRAYDPLNNSSIRPLNRIWLYYEFSGRIGDIFKGYVSSWQQEWPDGGWSDAVATFEAVDEFRVLASTLLPTTDPPRSTYADAVMFDQPIGYWRMDDDPSNLWVTPSTITSRLRSLAPYNINTALSARTPLRVFASDVSSSTGPALKAQGGSGLSGATTTAIVGDLGSALTLTAPTSLTTGTLSPGDPGDAGALSQFAVEFWLQVTAYPTGSSLIMGGPSAGGVRQWRFLLSSAGVISLTARNTVPTDFTVTGPTLSSGSSWYHIVGTVQGGNLVLYVNGVSAGSTAWSGLFNTSIDATFGDLQIGSSASDSSVYSYDEVAVYRFGLTASRASAHYVAGSQRGFPAQAPGLRINSVLESIGSHMPRNINAGTRTVIESYNGLQISLDEIRKANAAEAVDAAFFVARDGTFVFLDAGHRSVAPYNTIQATFDDDGTDLPYDDLVTDYSDSFLTNEWNVTRTAAHITGANPGVVQSASDATSISRYFKRSRSIEAPVTLDSDALAIANALLAKYKDPLYRITSISFTTIDKDVTEAVLQRELMDKVRILRTPPGGGSRIQQDVFIQKIDIQGSNDGKPWTIRWGVSPL